MRENRENQASEGARGSNIGRLSDQGNGETGIMQESEESESNRGWSIGDKEGT